MFHPTGDSLRETLVFLQMMVEIFVSESVHCTGMCLFGFDVYLCFSFKLLVPLKKCLGKKNISKHFLEVLKFFCACDRKWEMVDISTKTSESCEFCELRTKYSLQTNFRSEVSA